MTEFRPGHAGAAAVQALATTKKLSSVRADDFEYDGRPYQSLSAIARHITGTRWNGWVFFGLKNHRRTA